MSFFWSLVLSLLCSVRTSFVPKEHDQSLTYWQDQGWQKLERVESRKSLKLTFALKQRNVAHLERLLLQVSDPRSPTYGKYISVQQITDLISPSSVTQEVVHSWLQESGVRHCDSTLNMDFLVCRMPCYLAEKLLHGTVFHYFRHSKFSKRVIRSVSRYHLPENVSPHIDFIAGVHRFPAVTWGKTGCQELREKSLQSLHSHNFIHIGVYPKVIRAQYNLTVHDVASHPNNSQVVAQFLEQYFNQADLSEFMSLFVGNEFYHRSQIDKVVGPNTGRSGVEASLDTQYITSLGANVTTWFWSTAGRYETQEPFLDWMLDVGNMTEVPWVHSVSYGDVESSLSVAYMQRINVEFMKAGLRGISILFASGDDGASCDKGVFSPAFPASSPYVTVVGGSALYNPFGTGAEKGADFSGGGFSNIFNQPDYQKEHVDRFFQIGTDVPPQQYFNKTGRAYPDVAALANHFWIVNNRIPVPGVLGTSASTPSVAGMISMLNDIRLHQGQPVMGFLNPFIYQNSRVFTDLTDGCNQGCLSGDKGFCAGKEWDPVTGNGTPNYPALVKAANLAAKHH